MSNPYAPPQAVVQDIAETDGRLIPADRGARLGASILDSFFFGLTVYAPFLIAVAVLGWVAQGNSDGASAWVVAGLVGCAGFAVWLFVTIKFMKQNGQSIGKKLLNIKVVRSNGTAASVGRLIWLRNVLNWFISIVPLYGIIDTLFIFGESRQCLHDKIADTIVINA